MHKMNGLTAGTYIIQPLTEELLGEIVRRIVEGAHPERIILFGSHAYGTPRRDSDVDLIVVKRDVVSKRRESVRIRKLLRGILLPFDIIVIRPEEFEFYADNWINSVFAEAKRKGTVLYEEGGSVMIKRAGMTRSSQKATTKGMRG
ncbi:nucleotidyltransferase domain-containing protein [Candidatus Poribacteria bacterium]|nr:nucleotidyltransferase domain-containing protein [Candidatus Poribacteria bacterium]